LSGVVGPSDQARVRLFGAARKHGVKTQFLWLLLHLLNFPRQGLCGFIGVTAALNKAADYAVGCFSSEQGDRAVIAECKSVLIWVSEDPSQLAKEIFPNADLTKGAAEQFLRVDGTNPIRPKKVFAAAHNLWQMNADKTLSDRDFAVHTPLLIAHALYVER
jgi:hypothetical protein